VLAGLVHLRSVDAAGPSKIGFAFHHGELIFRPPSTRGLISGSGIKSGIVVLYRNRALGSEHMVLQQMYEYNCEDV
jgi:hypothetical protein